jgi:hypothetical protein
MRRFIGSALLALVMACGGDSTGPSVAGNYTLRTVNGANVPAVVLQDAQEKDELTSGNINLSSSNSWTGLLSVRATDVPSGQTFTFSAPANGTFTTSGNSITLTDAADGSQLTGTVGGGTLSISGDIGLGRVITLVFKR